MPSNDRDAFDDLRSSGALITRPGADEFDAERERVTWNRRLACARSPAAIAVVRSAEEAASAIRAARAIGLTVSVRGGGHSYEAAALRDGTLLLDLGALNSIVIDHSSQTARVGVGVRDGPLSEELAAAGFAFPVGHCSDVSLSGYLLAGGFGWNAGAWGAACGNVLAVEMVTAQGEMIEATERDHADLFWAARGHGPGFFAAITGYTIALHSLPATAYERGVSFPLSAARQMANWLSRAIDQTPRDVEIGSLLTLAGESAAPVVHVRATACGDSTESARDKLAAFTAPPGGVAGVEKSSGQSLPFTDLFRFSHMPSGMRVAADHVWSDAKVGDLLLALRDVPPPNASSSVNVVAFGGHSPVALPDGALSLTGGVGAGIYGLWEDAADDARIEDWVARVDTALAPFRAGRYVGEAALARDPARRAECFTPEAFTRLEALRAQHDPDGVFARWP